MKKYLILESDGRFHQVGERHDGKRHRLAKGQRLVEVPHHTLDPDCERWDEGAGAWVLDADKRARIDAEVERLMTPHHVRAAQLEARIEHLEKLLNRGAKP